MRRLIVLNIFFYSLTCSSQVLKASLESVNQYYIGDDKIKLDDDQSKNKFRSNTYLNLGYDWNNIETVIQLESYYPKTLLNFNPKLEKINFGFVSLGYKNYEKGLEISLGHFYEQFGSGLALRLYENRNLGFNNSLFGSKLTYNLKDILQIKLLAGKQRIGLGFDFSNGFICGSDIEFSLSELFKLDDNFKISGTFVSKNEEPVVAKMSNNVNILGPRLEYSGDNFSFGVEYLMKSKDIYINGVYDENLLKEGNATLLNTSYNKGAIGINMNIRRLENFRYFSQSDIQGNQYLYGTINYMPSLTKFYKYSLQNLYIYQPQPKMVKGSEIEEGEKENPFETSRLGDIGGQIDVLYEIPKKSLIGGNRGLSIALNGSYWSGIRINVIREKNRYGVYDVTDIESKSFLGIGKKYYSDFGVELKKTVTSSFISKVSYLQQYMNLPVLELKPGILETHTIVLDNTINLLKQKSVRLEIQHQSANVYLKNWVAGLLEFTLNSKTSFFVKDDYNYGNSYESQKVHYYTLGGSYSYNSTRLSTSYGRQRGGVSCAGGICRVIPESNGFNLNLTTQF